MIINNSQARRPRTISQARRPRTIKLIAVVICFAAFTSCLKEDDATVLLPLPIGEIYGVDLPQGMLDHIGVNEGTTPPDVDGAYLASPLTLEYASDNYWNDDYYDLYVAFTQVEGRLRTTYRESQSQTSGTAPEARIIGSGNSFTVYFTSQMRNDAEQWSCTTLTIISGRLTSQGIEDFQYCNAMLSKNDPLNKIMAVGDYHVFSTKGVPAVPYQW